tara:strand:+ start:516 stop:818 length:303 start_codon:yes stop_codon:yes gene_type:complete
MSPHHEQLKALYYAAQLDQLYEIAAALELEPWLHLVRSQRRFDDALQAKVILNHASVHTFHTARQEYRCAIEQLQYALIGVGITFDGVVGKCFEMEAHNV